MVCPYSCCPSMSCEHVEMAGDDGFSITSATPLDAEAIIAFLLTDFAVNEALNKALDVQPDEIVPFWRVLLQDTLASGTSLILRNAIGRIIGVRLSSILEKEREGDEVTEHLDLHEKAQHIAGIMDKVDEHKWERLPPGMSKLFYICIISISEDYARRGLASRLLNHDLSALKESGVQGIICEATGMHSQKLFEKEKFSTINEILYEEYLDENGHPVFNCGKDTPYIKLMFKGF